MTDHDARVRRLADHIKTIVAQLLEKHHPDRVLSQMTKALRTGKVFVDWSQNSRHKTTIGAYSLRAQPALNSFCSIAFIGLPCPTKIAGVNVSVSFQSSISRKTAIPATPAVPSVTIRKSRRFTNAPPGRRHAPLATVSRAFVLD